MELRFTSCRRFLYCIIIIIVQTQTYTQIYYRNVWHVLLSLSLPLSRGLLVLCSHYERTIKLYSVLGFYFIHLSRRTVQTERICSMVRDFGTKRIYGYGERRFTFFFLFSSFSFPLYILYKYICMNPISHRIIIIITSPSCVVVAALCIVLVYSLSQSHSSRL